jgi:CheY-like chemotaxis protein
VCQRICADETVACTPIIALTANAMHGDRILSSITNNCELPNSSLLGCFTLSQNRYHESAGVNWRCVNVTAPALVFLIAEGLMNL